MICLCCMIGIADEWETDVATLSPEDARSYTNTKNLFEEVSLLNLINGLHLGKDQMTKLAALAEESSALRETTLKTYRKKAEEFALALNELREKLIDSNVQVPPCCEQNAVEREHALNEAKKAYYQKLNALEEKVRAILSDGQVRVINEFNPCLIPPKDLKDPVRAGQAAGDFEEVYMHLEHLRNMPEKAFNVIGKPLTVKVVEEHFSAFCKNADDKTREANRILKVLKKCRAMSDSDFALEKEALARELLSPMTSIQEKVAEITQFFANQHGGMSKVGRFMLDPRIVPLLKRKLENLAKVDGANHDETTAADSCKDNKCGEHSDPEQEALVCKCGDKTFAWFKKEFGISDENSDAARKALAKAQVKLLDFLAEPAEDGTIPLVQLFTNPQNMQKYLEQCPPNSDRKYVELAEEIKRGAERSFKKLMTAENYEKYSAAGIDIFKIHCGNLNKVE